MQRIQLHQKVNNYVAIRKTSATPHRPPGSFFVFESDKLRSYRGSKWKATNAIAGYVPRELGLSLIGTRPWLWLAKIQKKPLHFVSSRSLYPAAGSLSAVL